MPQADLPSRSERVPPWLVGGVLAGLSLVAALQTYRSGDTDERVRFARASERVAETLTFRMRGYVNALLEARGLFMVVGIPDRQGFARFVDNIEISARLPGVQGVGFAERVRTEELPAWRERQKQATGDVHLWPREPARPEHSIITLIEPLDWRNRRALGFDMLTEQRRAAAMLRARDTGVAAATEIVRLVQETDLDTQPGFLIYVPVYRRGEPVSTVDDRRRALLGWVYSPFRARDLFIDALGDTRMREVAVRVYDGNSAEPDRLLYEGGIPDRMTLRHPRPPLRREVNVDVAGRSWTLLMTESGEGGFDATYEAIAVLIVGLLITTLVLRTMRITQRHVREQRVLLAKEQEANQLARDAIRSREDVLAVVSHDLRNPLNAVQLSAHVLARVAESPSLGEAERRSAERATSSLLRSTERMRLLLNDLVDLARIDAGGLSVELEPHDVGDVIREAVDLQMPLAEQRGLRLASHVADGLPRALCDRGRVLQILSNLIGNAVKFTPAGGSIEVEARRIESGDPRLLEISVRDNGRGIGAGDLGKVFDRYFQTDKNDRHGVGLGLFIVRSLVEAQGGRIEAESTPGKGSTFRFTLGAEQRVEEGRPLDA